MRTDDFAQKFESYLDKLAEEISQYPDDKSLWQKQPGINNSAGNLCLHLLGNLNHYIGAGIGSTGYVRNRPAEFTDTGKPKAQLIEQIAATRETIVNIIRSLDQQRLSEIYEGGDPGSPTATIGAELLNIITHFGYHLGQINYHRRLSTQ
jgi:hypothetical protein